MTGRKYEFRVCGRLSDPVREAVGEFSDVRIVAAEPETLIYGTIDDQSHLHGLLVLLENLGLHIVSVHEIPAMPVDRR
ncbi:hypothetical protein HFP15_05490 [Amycolatopsis sp. K13G38]|uniref:Uncharacterized protein n=1 Tax=Amycolatopsis acididurans TaxID=2724524 RepID=A0ABX1J018_9PSEU|nr:hypothetical protein [Amycolatopsis acididurans]NKQ52329.1 hypothetical protein [Amycolatopsis acididurans]